MKRSSLNPLVETWNQSEKSRSIITPQTIAFKTPIPGLKQKDLSRNARGRSSKIPNILDLKGSSKLCFNILIFPAIFWSTERIFFGFSKGKKKLMGQQETQVLVTEWYQTPAQSILRLRNLLPRRTLTRRGIKLWPHHLQRKCKRCVVRTRLNFLVMWTAAQRTELFFARHSRSWGAGGCENRWKF